MIKAGQRVTMSRALMDELRAGGSGAHVDEFGGCIGIVEGLLDYNAPGSPPSADKFGPEVDVRWLPSRLRYGYHPDKLRPVRLVIAIDGPAASGKGTLARRVADYLGYEALDTGLLYRAVARDMLAARLPLHDEAAAARVARALDTTSLDDPSLREPRVGEGASVVAKVRDVRAALLDVQRSFAARCPGAVLDGRDIGTVVCPDADVKIYVDADVEVRAARRYNELVGRGEDIDQATVLAMIKARDARDMDRADSPMRPADDATLLDTTKMDIEAAFEATIELIMRKIGQLGA